MDTILWNLQWALWGNKRSKRQFSPPKEFKYSRRDGTYRKRKVTKYGVKGVNHSNSRRTLKGKKKAVYVGGDNQKRLHERGGTRSEL